VTVTWKQPGDDWLCGRPARYLMIASNSPIDDPYDGRVVVDAAAAAGGAGQAVSKTLTSAQIGTAQYVAVLYRDEVKNWGLLRSAPITAAP
jgi:hypothetical protein